MAFYPYQTQDNHISTPSGSFTKRIDTFALSGRSVHRVPYTFPVMYSFIMKCLINYTHDYIKCQCARTDAADITMDYNLFNVR